MIRPADIARGALVLLLDAVALLLLSELMPGFTLDGPGAALGSAAVVGLANALVWPLLSRATLLISVLTLGIGALVLNGLLISLALSVVPGAQVADWATGIVVAIGIAALTTIASSLLAIDDDAAWNHHFIRRRTRRAKALPEGDRDETPGVIFLEIDGLAYDVLQRALRDGNAPTLSRWIREGSHHLVSWETDWSSQTGACQAGLLHGDNHDMPAFRWWEKDRGAPIVTNHPRDAEELERRRSNGRGLLHAGGASRANILSGDAPHSMLTMSTVLHRRRPIGRDYSAYFAQPYAVARTLVLAIADILRERRAQALQHRRDVHPRIRRSRTYALIRAWATVVQLDLQVAAVVDDMLAGRPAVYTTFLAYDEVAHHSGIERPDTLAVLYKVDRQIARIARAERAAPRPYRFVVLSDHGQSQGATFLQRYGISLEDLVRSLCDASTLHSETGEEDGAAAYLSAGLTELARDDTATGRAVRGATRNRRDDGIVRLDADTPVRGEHDDHGSSSSSDLPELSVMASGNLGLISFPREPGRVTLERLDELYPKLLPALRSHPGIAFAMVRSAQHGAVALGPRGTHYLDEERVDGEDPLAPFGPNAVHHLRRTDAFPHCPDVMVNSTYWTETGEVAAFEELVGSHGGLGGTQSHPFVAYPADLEWPADPVVGSEAVHRILCGWLAELGHESYREPASSSSDSPGSSTLTSTDGATSAT